MSYTYILSNWKSGASFTKGYTEDEYFYNQVISAIKENLKNKTLPFFNNDIKSVPRELLSGKIIKDENLIALEQVAAKNKYNSNLWLYGADLEKFSREGIKIKFKPNAEPVLCMTKFKNPIHLESLELYINEGGSKNNFQFLYNFDSLTPETQNALIKYTEKAYKLDQTYTQENYNTFQDNLKKDVKNNKKIILEIQEKIRNDRFLSGVDCASIIEAQYTHNLYQSVGAKMQNPIKEERKQKCYTAFNNLFNQIDEGKINSLMVAENLTKKMYSAAIYQRTMTSKNLNLETSKLHEEKMKKTVSYNGWER